MRPIEELFEEELRKTRATGAVAQSAASEDATATQNRTANSGPNAWPKPLRKEAFCGTVGEIIEPLAAQSEADTAAILIHLLVFFGNIIGRGSYFPVGGTKHHTNLFAVIVGRSSNSRKGTAANDVLQLATAADSEWCDRRIQSGLSSGEGLLFAVRDQIERREPVKEKGRVVDYQDVVVDAGEQDKRLLIIEPEFAKVLTVMAREGNTISTQIRQAWETGALRTMTKSPLRSTAAHISILGHITRDELVRSLTGTEMANGFANRFLWLMVKREKFLPHGGYWSETLLGELRAELKSAIDAARQIQYMKRSPEANTLWEQMYPKLAAERFGLAGAMAGRAEAQVLRLSMVYALINNSAVIGVDHLLAALEVWRYVEDSIKFLFGLTLGDPVADSILAALRLRPDGMTRTELSGLFTNNKRKDEIDRALFVLVSSGLAHSETQKTGGRDAERWFASARGTAK